jgi:hypothetical protein
MASFLHPRGTRPSLARAVSVEDRSAPATDATRASETVDLTPTDEVD